MHNLFYGNEFDLQDNRRAGKTNVRFKGQGCAPVGPVVQRTIKLIQD